MKNRLIVGSILIFLISACMSSNLTTTLDVQKTMVMTRENSAMQTIIALEQVTNTSTPTAFSNLPEPWTEITSITTIPNSTPHSAFASALKPITPVLVGAGYNSYRMACYVDEGTQLMITGRNMDSSWLRVAFNQGQTCFVLDESSNRTNIIPDPTMQLWVFHSTITISGDLSEVAIITAAGTPTP